MYVALDDASVVATLAHDGPFVTAYLDATSPVDGGRDGVDRRWMRVAATLTGVDLETVEAIEEGLTNTSGDTSPHGVLVVAAEGELCLTRRTLRPPAADVGFHSPLPRLLPYLVQTMPAVANLVIVVDVDAPRIVQAVGTELRPLWTMPAAIHGDGDLLLTRAVARLAAQLSPELVVVAGTGGPAVHALELARTTLRPGVTLRVAARDVRKPAALTTAIDSILRTHVETARGQALASVRALVDSRSRHDAVAGLRAVVAALRMAQVDCVVLADGPDMTRPCWVGDRPTEFGLSSADARAAGVRAPQQDTIGSALIRAVVATGARLLIAAPGEISHPQGIAAVLRSHEG